MEDKTYKYITLVKSKLYFVLKDELYEFAIKNRLTKEGKFTKGQLIDIIENNLDQALALKALDHFKNTIGYTAAEIEDILKISKAERIKWTKKKILIVTGSYEVRAYGTYLNCPIYSGVQIIDLTEKGVEGIRGSIKQPTEKQLAAITKARQKSIDNRTCKNCGNVVKAKNQLNLNGLCKCCAEKEYIDKCSKEALQRRKYWLEHKDEFLILDSETTGLNYNDEIVQIGIIDLNGNVLIDQLVKPTQEIPIEVIQIHGITNEMVSSSPTWKEVYPRVRDIIRGKTIIAYNASFDIDMMHNSCRKYDITPENIKSECLMNNTMEVWGTERRISLQDAINAENINIIQDHRAVGDCYLCLELIKTNGEDRL